MPIWDDYEGRLQQQVCMYLRIHMYVVANLKPHPGTAGIEGSKQSLLLCARCCVCVAMLRVEPGGRGVAVDKCIIPTIYRLSTIEETVAHVRRFEVCWYVGTYILP